METREGHRENGAGGPIIQRRWVRWLFILSCYTLIGLFFCGQNVLRYVTRGDPILWDRAVYAEMLYWYIWALLTPFILWYARCYRIERFQWWRGLLAHLLLSLVVAPFQEFIWRLNLFSWILDHQPVVQVIERVLQWKGPLVVGSLTGFYKYWMIVAIYYAFDYYRKYRQREREALDFKLRATQLEAQLTSAQLDALKMQLHPHFLFNTLNAISVLMRAGETQTADQMLLRLSDLLRVTLENVGAQEVSLKQELDFLKRYLDIEQIRFQDRLTVQLDIDPDTLDVQVPNLILQPLVENAVRHGIASRLAPGHIIIRSQRADGMLTLEVRDDGPGLSEEALAELKEGVGLSNTRARLMQHYGTAHRFELGKAIEGGLRVALAIPIRTDPTDPTTTPTSWNDAEDQGFDR